MRIYPALKMLLTARKISITVGINKFIRFLQKLPVAGKRVSDSLYSNKDAKIGIFAAVCALKALNKIIFKALYVGFFLVLLPSVIPSVAEDDLRIVLNVDAVMMMFFSASFLGASLALAKCINFDMGQDLVLLDKFRADANIYMPLRIFEHKVYDFILFLPYVFILAITEKYTVLDGLTVLAMLECVKMVFESLILFGFSAVKNISSTSYKIFAHIYLTIGASSIVVPIVLISMGKIIDVKPLITHPLALAASAALAALSVLYIRKYKYYRELAWSQIVNYNITVEKVKSDHKKRAFGDARKWNKNSETDVYLPEKIAELKGYSFFNSLFFFRHRKYFRKKILIRSLFVIAAGIVVLSVFFIAERNLLFIFDDEKASEISEPFVQEDENADSRRPTSLQLFVFFAYALSIGRQATAAMFSNCDITMLRHKFYRDKKIIIGNFTVRLKKILTLNIPIFLSLLLTHLAIEFVLHKAAGEPFFSAPSKFLISAAAFAALWLFFSFHDLFIYYMIQPYNEEYAAKNIWFNIVQTIVYIISYLNLFVDAVDTFAYAGAIAAVALLYFASGMAAVYRFSEKTFKLR